MAVTQGIIGAGGEAVFHFGDVSQVKDVMGLIRMTIDRYTRIDILVNNAGLQHIAPIPEFRREVEPIDWRDADGAVSHHQIRVSAHDGAEERADYQHQFHPGLVSAEFKAAYVSAKHGVIGLTKVTALEGAPHNITAVAVCPCFVRTPLAEKQIAGQAKFHGMTEQEVVEKIMTAPAALKRMLEPEEVAALVVYLATDVAQCITGSAVPIDCGWTAR